MPENLKAVEELTSFWNKPVQYCIFHIWCGKLSHSMWVGWSSSRLL